MSDMSLNAYHEFMLQGKRASGVGGSNPSTPVAATSPTQRRGLTTSSSSGKKKGNKSETAVFRAFQGRLQEWKDLDDQLDAVLDSIANLRDRIWWETRQLDLGSQQKPWQGAWCYRPTSTSALHRDDVQLALTHDLLQQEQMLTTSRNLIAALAQAQDAMGRRIDEWMMMDLMQMEDTLSEQGQAYLEESQTVYVFLAQELYRKQELVKMVLSSSHDGLVDKEVVVGGGSIGNPRSAARRICAAWASKDSEMMSMTVRLLNEGHKI